MNRSHEVPCPGFLLEKERLKKVTMGVVFCPTILTTFKDSHPNKCVRGKVQGNERRIAESVLRAGRQDQP